MKAKKRTDPYKILLLGTFIVVLPLIGGNSLYKHLHTVEETVETEIWIGDVAETVTSPKKEVVVVAKNKASKPKQKVAKKTPKISVYAGTMEKEGPPSKSKVVVKRFFPKKPQKIIRVASKTSSLTPLPEKKRWELLRNSPWPDDMHKDLHKVILCESGWRTGAVGPTNDYGLTQIQAPAHQDKFGSIKELHNPAINLAVAWKVYLEAKTFKRKDGWAPWVMSNKCHGLLPRDWANRIIAKSKW